MCFSIASQPNWARGHMSTSKIGLEEKRVLFVALVAAALVAAVKRSAKMAGLFSKSDLENRARETKK